MKNDGSDHVQGIYYQVFGPENIKKGKTIKNFVDKLRKNFERLLKHWNNIRPIKIFHYAANDKYNGIPAPIHQELIALGKDNPSVTCKVFSSAV